MVGKKNIALILSVLVLAAEANNGIQKVDLPALSESKNWEGLGLTADVNIYVDETIHKVVPLMRAYGLDPMALPDVEEGFEVVKQAEVDNYVNYATPPKGQAFLWQPGSRCYGILVSSCYGNGDYTGCNRKVWSY